MYRLAFKSRAESDLEDLDTTSAYESLPNYSTYVKIATNTDTKHLKAAIVESSV